MPRGPFTVVTPRIGQLHPSSIVSYPSGDAERIKRWPEAAHLDVATCPEQQNLEKSN